MSIWKAECNSSFPKTVFLSPRVVAYFFVAVHYNFFSFPSGGHLAYCLHLQDDLLVQVDIEVIEENLSAM